MTRRRYRYYFKEKTYLIILLVAGVLVGVFSEIIYRISFRDIANFFGDISAYISAVWELFRERIGY